LSSKDKVSQAIDSIVIH